MNSVPHLTLSNLLLTSKAIVLSLLIAPITVASPIIPEANSTGTLVNANGQQFDIEGGLLSEDRANLFHSFEQFGLNAGQVANFLSAPNIQNILGRVVGGNPSIINGLIQVTGGNSHLFLMNPAGIVFGSNASLNVPGDFTATTATGIGFGENGWFDAFGSNDYNALIGNPTQFAFDLENPAAILNHGNLTAQNLTLLAGSVTNTRTLRAPGGNVILSAVPGTSLVRISQSGHLLNLELPSDRIPPDFSPLDIPELLTGEPETAEVLGDVDASNSDGVGGNIVVLGNMIEIDANLNASGRDGGGNIWIGGDYLGGGELPTADYTTISSDSTIQADAIANGDGGRIILWSDKKTDAGNALISARGGANGGDGGFVETSSKDILIFTGIPDLSSSQGKNGIWLIDPSNTLITPGNLEQSDLSTAQIAVIEAQIGGVLGTASVISQNQIENSTGTVFLLSTDHVIVMDGLNGGKLTTPTDLFIQAGLDGTGSVFLNSDIEVHGSATIAAPDTIATLSPLTLRTNSDTTLTASQLLLSGSTLTTTGQATLIATGGNIAVDRIVARGATLQATGDLTLATGVETTTGDLKLSAGGAIALGGTIGTLGGNIDLTTGGDLSGIAISSQGGDLRIAAAGDVTFTNLLRTSQTVVAPGNTGNVTISAGGDLNLEGIIDTFAPAHDAGGISLPKKLGLKPRPLAKRRAAFQIFTKSHKFMIK